MGTRALEIEGEREAQESVKGGDDKGGDGEPVVPLKWNNADAAGVQKADRESGKQQEVR